MKFCIVCKTRAAQELGVCAHCLVFYLTLKPYLEDAYEKALEAYVEEGLE